MIKDFALDLKVARRKSGLTQADCAHLMGGTSSKICQLEKGIRTPALKEICTLSLIYGKSFESLFGAIFHDIRTELAENLTTMPESGENWAGTFNRQHTLERVGKDLIANLEDYEPE